jgi:hypothetical protein
MFSADQPERFRGPQHSVRMNIRYPALHTCTADRNLRRLARRAFIGVGNTGSSMGNGSGDPTATPPRGNAKITGSLDSFTSDS